MPIRTCFALALIVLLTSTATVHALTPDEQAAHILDATGIQRECRKAIDEVLRCLHES